MKGNVSHGPNILQNLQFLSPNILFQKFYSQNFEPHIFSHNFIISLIRERERNYWMRVSNSTNCAMTTKMSRPSILQLQHFSIPESDSVTFQKRFRQTAIQDAPCQGNVLAQKCGRLYVLLKTSNSESRSKMTLVENWTKSQVFVSGIRHPC